MLTLSPVGIRSELEATGVGLKGAVGGRAGACETGIICPASGGMKGRLELERGYCDSREADEE